MQNAIPHLSWLILINVIFSSNIYFYCNIRYVILSDAFNKDVIIIIIIIIIINRNILSIIGFV